MLYLVKQGKIDPVRVFLKSGDINKSPAKEGDPGNRVEFEIVAE